MWRLVVGLPWLASSVALHGETLIVIARSTLFGDRRMTRHRLHRRTGRSVERGEPFVRALCFCMANAHGHPRVHADKHNVRSEHTHTHTTVRNPNRKPTVSQSVSHETRAETCRNDERRDEKFGEDRGRTSKEIRTLWLLKRQDVVLRIILRFRTLYRSHETRVW